MIVSWFEFRGALSPLAPNVGPFVLRRMMDAFTPEMLPMTGVFALLGALFGTVYISIEARFQRTRLALRRLETEMARQVPAMIAGGENERVEFKATARWDRKQRRVNRALGEAIARTIAALANHEGGSLLIGVEDDGTVAGLEDDYETLRRADRDGFAQFITGLVREQLGAHVCRLVHVMFVRIENRDVCRVVVDPSDAPVYLNQGGRSTLYVRTGNASRRLDAREVVQYVASRWGTRGLIP